ncbi:MAG: sugar phosphate isomerase/epimerase [Acidobacteriota bacterium]|nr:sugar phosphate isomerase/epimerase [Acidobacteriota bacterium]
MKLGIVADEIDPNFATAVSVGTKLGLRRYEVRFLTTGRAPMCNVEELQEVERIAAAQAVEITALSPGLFKLTEDEKAFARQMSEVYPRAAEWAHRWNLPALIVFGFRKPGATEENAAARPLEPVPNKVVEWLSRAGEQAQSDGLLLMIEPEPICWADTARATAALIERSNARALRINYDPGNVAWFEQRDPIHEFAAAAPWIANVHVKDLLPLEPGASRPTFVPAGEGIIDYTAHFRALRDAGYKGPISLEPHMDGNPETIRRCIKAAEKTYERDTARSN